MSVAYGGETPGPSGRSADLGMTVFPATSLRIAMAIPDLSGGGAERSTLQVARGLIDRGHMIDLVLFQPRIRYLDEFPEQARCFVPDRQSAASDPSRFLARHIPLQIENHGEPTLADYVRFMKALKWNLLTLPNAGMFKQARFIAEYVKNESPDCIVPALPKSKVATLLAKTLLPDFPPVVPIIRNVIENRRRRNRRRYRLLMSQSAHIVAVSEGVLDSVSVNIGVPREKITVIPNSISTSELRELQRQAPGHPWFSDGGPPVILACGRLARVKDHATLLRAFHRVAKVLPHRLVILGEGPMRRKLEDLVHDLNLKDRVSLPGWTANPFAFMARSSLFVLSSRYEGFSRVLIEALACGCPCVSVDCPAGPSEILAGGQFGTLVPVGDDLAMANGICRTLGNPPEKRKLIDRAALFSLERAAEMYDRVIMNMVRQSEARSEA